MRVVLAGYGVEGKASYEYWRSRGDEVVIADERAELQQLPPEARTLLGPGVFARLEDFDVIVRSPSVHPEKLPYGDAVWSASNEFFARCPAPIIGVTGTKGKGTTSSLIASILQAAGYTVHLVGNIGVPALKVLPEITADHIVVYELSSFQLWDIKRSPHVAVVLMIEPDHLDVHHNLKEYIAAKANIVRFQTDTDIVVYNKDNVSAREIAESSPAQRVAYPFAIDEYRTSIKLPGEHNIENAAAAIAATSEYVHEETIIRKGLASFSGLPHRLKFVREIDGIRYYDDSIATTPGSAIAALQAFDVPTVILLGGSDKGTDYLDIVKECRARDAKVIAIGQTGLIIRELCQKLGVICTRVDGLMNEAVQKAHELAHSGDTVILSPASASFDQYRSYSDRGDQFISAVKSLN